MGKDIINTLKDGPIKKWYENNITSFMFDFEVNRAIERGYNLDTKSGLLFRGVYSNQIIKQLGNTIIDILFLRPVDLHHHEDVHEALKVIDGKGDLYMCKGNSAGGLVIGNWEETLYQGKEVYIPKNWSHSFRPNKEDFLEIRVACSGILDPSKEVCEKRFDEFEPWIDYYKNRS